MVSLAIKDDDYDSLRSHLEELNDLFREIPEQ